MPKLFDLAICHNNYKVFLLLERSFRKMCCIIYRGGRRILFESLFYHTISDKKFITKIYKLTEMCLELYNKRKTEHTFVRKERYIMRKEDEERRVNRERMEEKEILDLYRNLNKNQKQRIKIIMRGMKGKVF